MKISQILESTTSGSVATVATPIGSTQKRNPSIYPGKGGNLFKGKNTNKKFAEAKLEEEDLIIIPGQGLKRKSGFIPHGKSRVDHEVEMAKSDLYQAIKNAKSVFELIKDRSEDEGLEGWVQEKIIKAADYLNTVREYLEGKRVAEMTGGVVAGGVAFESQEPVNEKFASQQQAKLMYAAAGDKDVAKKTGVSQKVAKEFVKKSHGQKVSELPKKVKKD